MKFTEAGRFGGGLAGGALGAKLGAAAAVPICTAIGIGTMGTGGLICGMVVSASGGVVVGSGMSEFGEFLGSLVYEGN